MIDFLPSMPFVEALEQARRDVAAWNAIADIEKQAKWGEWAGAELEAMMSSSALTTAYLESSNAELRLAAVALVVFYWRARESFAAPCLRLAFEDSETIIRGGALKALMRLSQQIDDRTGFLQRLLDAVFGQPSEELRAKARRVAKESTAFVQRTRREIMKELAGDHLESMLRSRAAAESYLTNPDPQLRRAALCVLSQNWERTEEFADVCEQFLRDDPDLTVRLRALYSLAAYYSHSDDRRIGQLLAQVVYESTEPLELRGLAYRMLFTVRGLPSAARSHVMSPRFRFPEEVDWQFVDTFLEDATGSEGRQ